MLNHTEHEWTRKKDKYRECFNAKAQRGAKKEISQRINAVEHPQ